MFFSRLLQDKARRLIIKDGIDACSGYLAIKDYMKNSTIELKAIDFGEEVLLIF